MRRITAVLIPILVLLAAAATAPAAARHTGSWTDATYFNDAAFAAADPYVMYDKPSGYYYAYSTEGMDDGWHFAVYRSADMVTWQKAAPGALPATGRNAWGTDWYWAPEVYYNARTHLYFMFYAARSIPDAHGGSVTRTLRSPARSASPCRALPRGPSATSPAGPIDYSPYDPNYHDVNLIMGPDQKKPPATEQQGETAPLGHLHPRDRS